MVKIKRRVCLSAEAIPAFPLYPERILREFRKCPFSYRITEQVSVELYQT